jgi:hypothetical protein
MANAYIEAILGKFVHVHQSEIRPLLHAFSAFFFVSTSLHIIHFIFTRSIQCGAVYDFGLGRDLHKGSFLKYESTSLFAKLLQQLNLPMLQQKLRTQIVYNGLPKFLGRLLYPYLHPLLGADELSG